MQFVVRRYNEGFRLLNNEVCLIDLRCVSRDEFAKKITLKVLNSFCNEMGAKALPKIDKNQFMSSCDWLESESVCTALSQVHMMIYGTDIERLSYLTAKNPSVLSLIQKFDLAFSL
jgi:hypothetical protein